MTYNPNIPQANDLISQSQAQIQTNFSQADTIFDTNHYTFDNSTVANRGKHRFSSYVEQGADPVTAANEIAIYSKDLAGVSQLYMRRESAGTVIQMSVGNPVVGNPGSTFLPGGIIMKWGFKNILSTGTAINFVAEGVGNFPTNCFGVTISVNQNAFSGGDAWSNIPNVAGFTARAVNNCSVFWVAMGN